MLPAQQCTLCILAHIKQPDIFLPHKAQAGWCTLPSSSVTNAATQQRQRKA
jgi:hypothetical protein